jgi:hypothetical protein
MPALSIQPPFPIFTDTDGQPLENGYIWIGTANQNPITNPITAYWDAALTVTAAQPVRTLNGYPVNAGTPARLYVNSDYSIQVQNKNGSVVYSAPAATDRFSDVVVNGIDSSEVSFLQAGTGAVTRTAQAKMRDFVSVKDFGAVGDGVTDDTVAIQAALTAMGGTGADVFLPRGTYKVSSALLVPTLTGLVSDGSATLYAANSGFNNADPSVSGRYVNNGVVINLSGQTTAPYTPKYGQKISGLKIQYQYAVGYSVNAIVARNCHGVEISNNEIFDFPLCRAIMVASLLGDSKIVGNYIHDLENNYVFPGYGFAERGQFNETGIDVDEDRVNSVLSNNLLIDRNLIENVHYGATAIATYEDQSDGITLRNATGIRVISNTVIDTNEGIDLQGFNTLVVGNVFSNCTGCGVKLIHGARYNVFSTNHIKNSGLAGIIVVGGLLSEGDTSFNVFSSNTIENVDPSNLHSGSSTACIRIQNQATTSVASNNTFVDNHIDPGVYGEFIVYNYTAGDVKNRYAGNLIQRSAVVEDFYIGPTLNAQVIQQIATNAYGYASSVDGVNNVTWKLVQLDAELFDTNSEFSTSAYTWTCKTPGYYRFIGQVGLVNSNGIQVKIRKNTTDYAYSRPPTGSGVSNQIASVSVTAYGDIDDVFDLYVYHSTGVAVSLATGAQTTFLCVSKA